MVLKFQCMGGLSLFFIYGVFGGSSCLGGPVDSSASVVSKDPVP